MDSLIKELDEICRESQELREQLSGEMARPIWPERRRTRRINPGSGRQRARSESDGEDSS